MSSWKLNWTTLYCKQLKVRMRKEREETETGGYQTDGCYIS